MARLYFEHPGTLSFEMKLDSPLNLPTNISATKATITILLSCQSYRITPAGHLVPEKERFTYPFSVNLSSPDGSDINGRWILSMCQILWQPVRKLDAVLNADFHNPNHSKLGTRNTK